MLAQSDRFQDRERIHSLDIVRTVAAVSVLLIHCSAHGFVGNVGSAEWLGALLWASISRAGVPLFFMCSGALLLGEGHSGSFSRIAKRLCRIMIALFFWAFVYKLYRLSQDWGFCPESLLQSVKEVFLFRHERHLYYLHILLLAYLLLPLVDAMIDKGHILVRYTLVLWFIFGILYPTVLPFWPFTLLRGIPLQWEINMTYASTGYMLLGYSLLHKPLKLRFCFGSAVSGAVMIFAGTLWLSEEVGELRQHFFEGMSIGACLLAAGLFSLIVRLAGERRHRGPGCKLFETVSRSSFCVYLLHPMALSLLADAGICVDQGPVFLTIPLFALLLLGITMLIWLLLSKVPIANRWLI